MKKRIVMTALALMLGTGVFSSGTVTALAAQTGTETQTQDESSAAHSLDEETFSKLVGFVKEKWDAGELETQDDIRAAIKEGEEEFAFDLTQDAEDMIVSVVEKLGKLNLDSDVVAEKAKELYKTYGDSIVEKAETVLAEEAAEVGNSISDALKEQVVEPAKEAASDAAKAVAKNFWSDLKNSVLNFVKNIFHI